MLTPLPVLPPRAVPPAPPQPRARPGSSCHLPGGRGTAQRRGPRSAPGGGSQLAPHVAGSTPAPHGSSFGPAEPELPVSQRLPRAPLRAAVPARPPVTVFQWEEESEGSVQKKGCSAASFLLSAPLLICFPNCQAGSRWGVQLSRAPCLGKPRHGLRSPGWEAAAGTPGKTSRGCSEGEVLEAVQRHVAIPGETQREAKLTGNFAGDSGRIRVILQSSRQGAPQEGARHPAGNNLCSTGLHEAFGVLESWQRAVAAFLQFPRLV